RDSCADSECTLTPGAEFVALNLDNDRVIPCGDGNPGDAQFQAHTVVQSCRPNDEDLHFALFWQIVGALKFHTCTRKSDGTAAPSLDGCPLPSSRYSRSIVRG